jgi:oxygen-independent coproporphyrinogen-3 oxidase
MVKGKLVSIYLGGGTPSLWRPDCVATVLAAIAARYEVELKALEITIEANPTDCEPERLSAWRAAGINRISIGVQSVVNDELVTLGRDHRFGDGPAALFRVLDAGGFVTSADFILGVPPKVRREVRPPAWIGPIAKTSIDHVSVYELTIEERTAFGQRVRDGRLVPLDDDTLTELYVATHNALTGAGFEHYEISSYARAGKRAVHNSLYWRGAAYLGLGVGAASLELAPSGDGSATRVTNPRRAADYLAKPGAPAELVLVTADQAAADRAWLGMRTSDGVAEADLAGAGGLADELVGAGLAERKKGRICPTLRGFLMADRIAALIVQRWGADRRRSL